MEVRTKYRYVSNFEPKECTKATMSDHKSEGDNKHTDSNDSRKAYMDNTNDPRKAFVGWHKDHTTMRALGLRGLVMSAWRYTSLHYLLVLCVMALGKSYLSNCR